jgi:hypothetical protein
MNDEFEYDPEYYGKKKRVYPKEKPTIRDRLKEIPNFLLYTSKCLSCFLPIAGEIITYRELRNNDADGSIPRKYCALFSLGLGAMKAPLFIHPCEETLALYQAPAWSEFLGVAVFSQPHKKDKKSSTSN